jgi:hypothetical protein
MMTVPTDVTAAERREQFEGRLNDFDPKVRAQSLHALLSLAKEGAIPRPVDGGLVNMHCHTFYSYNAYGHSPTSLAWLAHQRGWHLVGIVDFDVLDGVDEFLDACQQARVRGTAGIETRVFVADYADCEINSPGEPGVCYHMGIGFASGTVPPEAKDILSDLGWRAEERNRAILARVNAHLSPVAVDYERDVLPLTPGGHPTERHLVLAYLDAVHRLHPDAAGFWAGALALEPEQAAAAMGDKQGFQNLVRSRLIKRGGAGYVRPESGMFPTLETFQRFVEACGALPCAAWLDGTSEVERHPEQWLAYLIGQGVVALNIIPDRNWNLADPELRRTQVRNLHQIVRLAQSLNLPLNIGTEMNAFGQKTVDDLGVPELAPLRPAFLAGAHFVYGHTQMQRTLGLGYQSDWAREHLPMRQNRTEFFTQVGEAIAPGQPGLGQLQSFDANMTPGWILHEIKHNEGFHHA